MSAIGPGDWVECIDVSPNPHYGPPPLSLGAVYQVESSGLSPMGLPGVWIVGIESAASSGGFRADRFRPIYRPKSEFIESLMQPAPELETA